MLSTITSDGESAADETTATLAPTTTIEAPSTTVAATTTETTSTTAGTAPELVVDEALAADFVAGVRDSWERTERTVGGSVPDLSDDKIVAIGTSVCEYLAANPLLVRAKPSSQQRMETLSEVSVIVCEAMGMPYDPALQDAGFESDIDARNVMAFKYTPSQGAGGLCPVPTSGPGSMPCSVSGCSLFGSPWSATASA